MTGGPGASTADTFVIATGDSTPLIGGAGNAGTITNYDVITDFSITVDKLNLPGTVQAATAGFVNGAGDSVLTIGGDTVESHSVTNGIVTFFGTDGGVNPLAVEFTLGRRCGRPIFVRIGHRRRRRYSGVHGYDLWSHHTYVYEQSTTNAGLAARWISRIRLFPT